MKSQIALLTIIVTGATIAIGSVMASMSDVSETKLKIRPVLSASVINQEDSPIQPVVSDNSISSRESALGKALFEDRRLSGDGSISCADCHDLSKGGTDGKTVSVGFHHHIGTRNSPTVFNCSLNYRQFWDGRATSLLDQMDGPVNSTNEMHSNWQAVATKLAQDEHYDQEFRALYEDGLQPENIKKAIATYEKSLTTPDSRFDLYLKGDKSAMTTREVAGYHLFTSAGCVSCHQGANLGGNMMQSFGVIADSHILHRDQQKNVNGQEGELVLADSSNVALFRVPALRNVALTAPYFHDGSAPTLRQAVKIIGYSQLGRTFSDHEMDLLIAFLNTLTGKYQGKQL